MLGESILPYRVFCPFEVALPIGDDGTIITETTARASDLELLANRLKDIEASWFRHGKQRYLFTEHLDYMRQLTGQFPIAPMRVVYAASGTLPAAAIVRDPRAVIEHKLYWSAPTSEDEAYFLMGILNSETARSRAERYQSRGQFGARDFDKVIFNLPIPVFDAREPLHTDLAAVGRAAERVASMVDLVEGEKFQRARKRVRDALAEDGVGGEIEKLVDRLLGPA